jgi:hypothetical protein
MPPDDAAEPPSPRRFAQGVGLLLQGVGGLLFFSTCCVCSMAWLVDPNLSQTQVVDLIQRDPHAIEGGHPLADPGRLGMVLNVMFTTVGGLGLMVFGMGLQSDKPRAAWGALATNVLLLVLLVAAGVLLWIGGGAIGALIWNAALVMIVAGLLAFCVAALRQVIRHPPPKGMDILPPDWEPPPRMH